MRSTLYKSKYNKNLLNYMQCILDSCLHKQYTNDIGTQQLSRTYLYLLIHIDYIHRQFTLDTCSLQNPLDTYLHRHCTGYILTQALHWIHTYIGIALDTYLHRHCTGYILTQELHSRNLHKLVIHTGHILTQLVHYRHINR